MKDSIGQKKEDRRKPYPKPEIEQGPLRREEAILEFCKTDTGAGRMLSACAVLSCLSPGS